MKKAPACLRAGRLGLAALSCIVSLAGCGYKLVDYSEPPEGLRSVSIRTFDNDTYDPGVELIVADAMRREFLRRGALSLEPDPESADLVIAGSVDRLRTNSRSFTSVALVLEWELTMRLKVRPRLRDGTVLPVDHVAMEETERYLASADVEVTRRNRQEALRKLSALLAARVHDMLYEAYRQ